MTISTYHFRVDSRDDGRPLRDVLADRTELSRSLVRQVKARGMVLVNGVTPFLTTNVSQGDRIELRLCDSMSPLPAEALPLDIIYEDAYLLVLNKPPGMPVHPTGSYRDRTLVNALAYHWRCRGLAARIRLVHRLDRQTSGLLLAAKNPFVHQQLCRQLQARQLQRTYLALACGRLYYHQGTIDAPLALPPAAEAEHGLQRKVLPGGKHCITHFRVLRCRAGLSLVKLRLETGRTHQIRAHLAWIGCPVLGDEVYGQRSHLLPRQALHAWSLCFHHPVHRKQLLFQAPLPGDMYGVWTRKER